tara:strand:- start:1228 stop:2274 length:1047 start_codon:yes stop_codon:yes gene_type:complete
MIIAKKNILIKSPFIVAEISGNHSGRFEILKKTVNAAIKCGVDAIKLQTYKPEDLTLKTRKKDFLVRGTAAKWDKKYLFEIYKKGQTPVHWYKKIFQLCKRKKKLCFTSPFNPQTIKELEKLGCPAYKIASLEITNLGLLKAISKTKKPVIISTGGATLAEINSALKIFKKNKNVALLKCTVKYPAKPEVSNLKTIESLQKKFKKITVGFSDHTIGTTASILAVSLGAKIIEKHFILNKKINSIDNFFSADPIEMKDLVRDCKSVKKYLGSVFYGPTKDEITSIKYRRSIYFARNARKGKKLNINDIAIVRPSLGTNLKLLDKMIGKKLDKNYQMGDKLSKNFTRGLS